MHVKPVKGLGGTGDQGGAICRIRDVAEIDLYPLGPWMQPKAMASPVRLCPFRTTCTPFARSWSAISTPILRDPLVITARLSASSYITVLVYTGSEG